jgi:DNA-binding SARP family transcriptional activator
MLSLHLLGARGLRDGGRDISASIHYRKGWGLLGYLAVERCSLHSREHLAQLLWPQLPAAAARTNLRQVVADLNRVFELHGAAAALESTREAIALRPGPEFSIDLLALEAAVWSVGIGHDAGSLAEAEHSAQALGGEFLAGFSLPDCEEFEEWLLLARGRLAAATGTALQSLCHMQESAGRRAQAIATAQRLVAIDEWNEAHQRRLVRLLAADAQFEQALARFDALCLSLRNELGSEPEAATVELVERIRSQQRSPQAPLAAPAGSLGVRRWISAVYCRLTASPTGERADALACVRERLEQGGGHVLDAGQHTLLACFGHDQATGGMDASAAQAARAALAARESAGVGAAMALCAGIARIEHRDGTLAVLGNPGEWATRLCEKADGGQVLLCPTLFRALSGHFDLRGLGEHALEGVSAPLPLWELRRERAIAADVRHAASLDSPRDAVPATHAARSEPETINLQTVRMATGAGLPEPPPSAWLAVLQGAGRGRRVPVNDEPLLVGRSPESDLQIVHRTVSRYHCAIWRDGGCYRIRDMGATNRTRVNDATVQEVELVDGDLIVVGDSVLQFGRQDDPPTMLSTGPR